MLVAMESLREHPWRILLDWPALLVRLDRQHRSTLFTEYRKLLPRIRPEIVALLDQAVFGENLKTWRQIASEADLMVWLVG